MFDGFSPTSVDVRILSKPRKSFMKGAQYLHEPIPGMGDQEKFDVDYRLIGGTTQDYAQKVYGAGRVVAGETSAALLEGIHPAWDIRAAYDALWDAYGSFVVPWEASTAGIAEIVGTWGADLIVSSIPAHLLCATPDQHSFPNQLIWSTDEAFHVPQRDYGENVVVCNAGTPPMWYRSAMIHGWGTTEWPNHAKPPLNSSRLWSVPKPIMTDCNCFPQILRVGRYGTWTKGVLSHHAYEDVTKELFRISDRLF